MSDHIVSFKFFTPNLTKSVQIPLILSSVPCGFESPAEEYIDRNLSLDELVVKHESTTFYIRASGKSMIQASIEEEDILVVDKALEPRNDDIVIACIDNGFLVKRFVKKDGEIFLEPCNSSFKRIKITSNMDFYIWGVVTHVLKTFRR